MRVLFITHEMRRNGAPIALLQELSFIKENCPDINVELLALNDGELKKDFSRICKVIKGWNVFLNFLNVILHKLNICGPLYVYRFMFLKNKYDCVYANTVLSLEAGAFIKEKLKIPLILHVHEAECLMHLFKINSFLISSVDSFITVSNFSAHNLVNNYGVPLKKIEIHPPISFWLDQFQKGEVKIIPFNYDGTVFLVGCFVDGDWFKSIELVPVLMKKVSLKYPDFNCKLALIGLINEEVKWRINYELKKIGCADKVVWLDLVKSPLNYHSRFDALLLLSREESFSLVAQEAAIMAKPIVGFHDTIGVEEWFGQNGGIWVPFLDFDAVADSLYELWRDVNLRTSLGAMAKKVALDMYNESKNMLIPVSAIRKYSRRRNFEM